VKNVDPTLDHRIHAMLDNITDRREHLLRTGVTDPEDIELYGDVFALIGELAITLRTLDTRLDETGRPRRIIDHPHVLAECLRGTIVQDRHGTLWRKVTNTGDARVATWVSVESIARETFDSVRLAGLRGPITVLTTPDNPPERIDDTEPEE